LPFPAAGFNLPVWRASPFSVGARGQVPARFDGRRSATKGCVQAASAGFRRSSGGIYSAV
ncbi:MAG TPA: hypothetical protein VF625_03345, partial [Longimicrobium sp.]